MEESPHSTEALSGKLQELLTDSDNDTLQFCFHEELIEQVMQEFYKEIACSPLPKPPSPTTTTMPPSSLSPSPSPPSYSVADSALPSKSITMDAGKVGMQGKENGLVEVQGGIDEFVGFGDEEEKKMKQGLEDGGGFDDEWLARVLTWGQGGDANKWF